jgi:hypothetical protein
MDAVVTRSVGSGDYAFSSVQRRSAAARRHAAWLRVMLSAAATPGGTPPGRARVVSAPRG